MITRMMTNEPSAWLLGDCGCADNRVFLRLVGGNITLIPWNYPSRCDIRGGCPCFLARTEQVLLPGSSGKRIFGYQGGLLFSGRSNGPGRSKTGETQTLRSSAGIGLHRFRRRRRPGERALRILGRPRRPRAAGRHRIRSRPRLAAGIRGRCLPARTDRRRRPDLLGHKRRLPGRSHPGRPGHLRAGGQRGDRRLHRRHQPRRLPRCGGPSAADRHRHGRNPRLVPGLPGRQLPARPDGHRRPDSRRSGAGLPGRGFPRRPGRLPAGRQPGAAGRRTRPRQVGRTGLHPILRPTSHRPLRGTRPPSRHRPLQLHRQHRRPVVPVRSR